MFAIQIVGPSGFVQYVTTDNSLSSEGNTAQLFNNEDDAEDVLDDWRDHSECVGRFIEVCNMDGE